MFLILLTAFIALAAPSPIPTAASAPEIRELINPKAYERAIREREIMTHATLDDLPGAGDFKKYAFYSAMLVHSSVTRAREVLTDYKLYAEMIPYIERAVFNEKLKILDLEGGIWKFKLASKVRFEEKGPRWIRYSIIAGSFTGLSGDILFESSGEKGTLVYIRGEQVGKEWPPAFVITRGAEIVFGFTAKRMRSYLESPIKDKTHGQELPQPKSGF
jgi:hypothetical protein